MKKCLYFLVVHTECLQWWNHTHNYHWIELSYDYIEFSIASGIVIPTEEVMINWFITSL